MATDQRAAPGPTPLRSTWQAAEADAIEVLAENVEFAVLSVERVEPKYRDRQEIRDAMNVLLGLLKTDVSNLRKEAEALRTSVRA